MNDYSQRLAKCFSSVIHDVMRDRGHKNFTLPPNIKPIKEKHKIAGQIFTVEGSSNPDYDHHETILAWTGFLSKAPQSIGWLGDTMTTISVVLFSNTSRV